MQTPSAPESSAPVKRPRAHNRRRVWGLLAVLLVLLLVAWKVGGLAAIPRQVAVPVARKCEWWWVGEATCRRIPTRYTSGCLRVQRASERSSRGPVASNKSSSPRLGRSSTLSSRCRERGREGPEGRNAIAPTVRPGFATTNGMDRRPGGPALGDVCAGAPHLRRACATNIPALTGPGYCLPTLRAKSTAIAARITAPAPPVPHPDTSPPRRRA